MNHNVSSIQDWQRLDKQNFEHSYQRALALKTLTWSKICKFYQHSLYSFKVDLQFYPSLALVATTTATPSNQLQLFSVLLRTFYT